MEEDLLHRLRCRSLWSYRASEITAGANKPKPANPKSASAAQKHRDGHNTVLECSPPVQAVLAVCQQGLKECKGNGNCFLGFLLKYYFKHCLLILDPGIQKNVKFGSTRAQFLY